MLPVRSAFSSPPIRCCIPAVPGIAHGRAKVSGSRRYGRNSPSSPLGAAAKSTSPARVGRSPTDGTDPGPRPVGPVAPGGWGGGGEGGGGRARGGGSGGAPGVPVGGGQKGGGGGRGGDAGPGPA